MFLAVEHNQMQILYLFRLLFDLFLELFEHTVDAYEVFHDLLAVVSFEGNKKYFNFI